MDTGFISCIISDNLIRALYVLVTLTMYHLYLGLAFVNQKKTMIEVNRKKKYAEIGYYIFFALFLLTAVIRIALIHGDDWMTTVAYSSQATATLAFIVYCYTIIKLRIEINLLEGMEQERKQIGIQSLLFLFTFFLITAISVLVTLNETEVISISADTAFYL